VKKLLERKPPSWLLTLDSLGNWIGILGLAVALISFFLRFGFLGDVLMLLGMWLGMTGLVASQFLHLALRKLGRLPLICPNCNRSIDRDKFCVYHDEVCKRLGF